MLKNLVRAVLPPRAHAWLRRHYRRTRDRLRLRHAYRHDRRVYETWAGMLRADDDQACLEAELIKIYHRIEKGLALASPRPGFGAATVDELLSRCGHQLTRFGPSLTLRRVVNVLDEYCTFNRHHGVDVSEVERRLMPLREACAGMEAVGDGGSMAVSRSEIHAASRIDLAPFISSRFSVRQFTGEAIDPKLIEAAVRMAQKTPSVCNRESGTVYALHDPSERARALAHQNGNRGFGEQAGCVLVVTSRLATFLTVGERHQCWIDGGMFSMSIVYALHSLGLGTCCLNWSVEPDRDLALRQATGIPADEAIVMMIAVGHLPDRFRVAQSPRRPLSEVLKSL